MPTPTYTPLANITLSSSAASVTFSSISQAYRDLVLVVTATASTTAYMSFRVNGDSAGNYAYVLMQGNGSTTGSFAYATDTGMYVGNNVPVTTAAGFNGLVNIMDYSVTDKHKSMLIRSNNASTAVESLAGRWANTAAVTTILCYLNTGSFASGSTFSLFGIAA